MFELPNNFLTPVLVDVIALSFHITASPFFCKAAFESFPFTTKATVVNVVAVDGYVALFFPHEYTVPAASNATNEVP
jgi:hypothetical protein